jgi:hypothetical protein
MNTMPKGWGTRPWGHNAKSTSSPQRHNGQRHSGLQPQQAPQVQYQKYVQKYILTIFFCFRVSEFKLCGECNPDLKKSHWAHIMLRDLFTQKCVQKILVTDFGYPRACRFRKHQILNRSPELALPT